MALLAGQPHPLAHELQGGEQGLVRRRGQALALVVQVLQAPLAQRLEPGRDLRALLRPGRDPAGAFVLLALREGVGQPFRAEGVLQRDPRVPVLSQEGFADAVHLLRGHPEITGLHTPLPSHRLLAFTLYCLLDELSLLRRNAPRQLFANSGVAVGVHMILPERPTDGVLPCARLDHAGAVQAHGAPLQQRRELKQLLTGHALARPGGPADVRQELSQLALADVGELLQLPERAEPVVVALEGRGQNALGEGERAEPGGPVAQGALAHITHRVSRATALRDHLDYLPEASSQSDGLLRELREHTIVADGVVDGSPDRPVALIGAQVQREVDGLSDGVEPLALVAVPSSVGSLEGRRHPDHPADALISEVSAAQSRVLPPALSAARFGVEGPHNSSSPAAEPDRLGVARAIGALVLFELASGESLAGVSFVDLAPLREGASAVNQDAVRLAAAAQDPGVASRFRCSLA